MSDFYPSRDTIHFPSTGDAREDDLIMEQTIRSMKRKLEGICPNGCGPLEYPAIGKSHCPKCKFTGYQFTLHVGGTGDN